MRAYVYIISSSGFSLFGGSGDEKTLVNYDELDEAEDDVTPAGGGGAGKPTRNAFDRCLDATCYKCGRACPCCCNFTMRFQVALLSSLGFLISFGIRCNMGVAILQMTQNKTIHVPRNVSVSPRFLGLCVFFRRVSLSSVV